ncbi:hypothetical protein GGI04_001607 [Coemansia thaxteri]|uniref:Uncharacterized protein n=1 Tax=Coemansia thaxteri TaxID=2663907 RepID=A0A9W8BGV7_9FUNG|nr:hypothetical protein GGI04_001607 [Coemansia thaxteri]KAJ2008069.1 hypothetical protein H4R26_000413 [Coemansia thaxteri]KAJ2483819.1 hypothetical protein EV174_002845 [Coemansia sp. RSA 2320]
MDKTIAIRHHALAALCICFAGMAAAETISVDCIIVGESECARLKALSATIGSADAKTIVSSPYTNYLIAAAVASVTAVVCIVVIIGLVLYARKRRARTIQEKTIAEQRSYEWDTTAVNTPTSSISDKTTYAYEEEVLFRLDVPINCL